MVVRFTTTYAISTYHYQLCEFESCSSEVYEQSFSEAMYIINVHLSTVFIYIYVQQCTRWLHLITNLLIAKFWLRYGITKKKHWSIYHLIMLNGPVHCKADNDIIHFLAKIIWAKMGKVSFIYKNYNVSYNYLFSGHYQRWILKCHVIITWSRELETFSNILLFILIKKKW